MPEASAAEDEPPVRPPWHWRLWLKVGFGLLIVVAIAAFALRNVLLGNRVDAYAAAVGELTQTVVASGRVATPQRIALAAEIAGRVSKIPVREGQSVERGQLLVALDDRDERAAVAQASALVAEAEARLRRLREVSLPGAVQGLAQAEANAEVARKQHDRMIELQARGFIGQVQLDDARRNDDIAASQVRTLRLQVQTNRPAGSESALAVASLAQARANLQIARIRLEQNAILAPTAGVLIARSVEPGDVVQSGKTLMVLAPNGETQILVQVDEKNFAKLSLGQKALASADAFAAQRFDAVVVYINPGIDAARGAVEVKLAVKNPPAYLRQDMTVSVDIETAHLARAIVIPTGAVHELSSAAPWVMVVRGQRTVRQPVTLGLRGDGRSEVLSGLAAGEIVIPAATATIKLGQRVRAQVAASP